MLKLSPLPRSRVSDFVHAHAVLSYFVLTFFLSWLIWVPLALNHLGLVQLNLSTGFVQVVRLFGTLGPALAATLVALLEGGRAGERALWASLGRWRVNWRWYVAACLVYPVVLLLVAWGYRQWPGAAPLPFQPVTLGNVVFIGLMLFVAVLGEEVGWRGFALPRLQQHRTALAASLLLGTLWTAWHLPFWIVLDELARFGWTHWLLGWAYIVAGTIYLTWLMNNTGNSLLLAVLFHWTLNLVSGAYLPLTTVVPAYAAFIVVAWIIAAGLLAWFGPARLVRGRA